MRLPGPICIEGGAAPRSGRGRRPRSGRPANRGHTCARTRHAVPRCAVRQKRPHAGRYEGALRLATGTESVRAHHSRTVVVTRGDGTGGSLQTGTRTPSADCHSCNPLLHEADGSVLPHCDCERLDCTVATLVIVLPSAIAREVVSHEHRRVRPRSSQPVPNVLRHVRGRYEYEVRSLRAGYRAWSQPDAGTSDRARPHQPTGTLAVPLEYPYTPDGLARDTPEWSGPRVGARAAHAPRIQRGRTERRPAARCRLRWTARRPDLSRRDCKRIAPTSRASLTCTRSVGVYGCVPTRAQRN